MFNLAHIVNPLSVDEFLSNYWGKEAVFISGNPKKVENLFGWDEVNNSINNVRPNFNGFRLVYEKTPLPPTEFSKVSSWLRRGATLVINNVDQIDPVMCAFNQALGNDLNTGINTNCYASHPFKQGFDTHFDRHDVFIVQTEGEKNWAVFHPTLEYPLHHQQNSNDEPPTSDPYIEQTLSPGDILYIPRGHWHHAMAESPSVHLTVGPQSRSGFEFLAWIAGQAMENEAFFRKDFPIADSSLFGGHRDSAEVLKSLDVFRQKFTDLLSDDQLAESFTRYVMTANPIKKVHTLQKDWVLGEKLVPQTEFSIVANQKVIVRYDEKEKYAKVFIRGHVLNLEGVPEKFLACLFDKQKTVISGEALMAECPDLKWEIISGVIIELHHLGLLELIDKS